MSEVVEKLLFPFSLILSLVSSTIYPPYIQLGAENLTFDYKTNDSRPLYFLNLKNIGAQKARFNISSDVDWIFITQEGLDNTKTIQLDVGSTVNFVLDIRTDLVNDGRYTAKITVDAIYLQDSTILETKDINIVLNKNFIPTPSPTGGPSPTADLSPSVVPSITVSPFLSASVIPKLTPTPIRTKIAPVASLQATPLKLITPKPEITPRPIASPTEESRAWGIWNFFRNIWDSIF